MHNFTVNLDICLNYPSLVHFQNYIGSSLTYSLLDILNNRFCQARKKLFWDFDGIALRDN